MPTSHEIATALRGVAGLVRMRPDAFLNFDASERGFWKSFWVAFAVLPLWAFALWNQLPQMQLDQPFRFVAFQTIAYAVSWLLYPLVMVPICDYLHQWPRYFTYMVAYNWFQVIQMLAWLPLLLLVNVNASRGLVALVWLGTHAVLLTYNWFIARQGLKVDAGAASALVIIDLLLGQLIDQLAQHLV